MTKWEEDIMIWITSHSPSDNLPSRMDRERREACLAAREKVSMFSVDIPDIISWPMYIRIEFIPGKMNGDPDQNLGEDRNSYVMLSPLYARSLPVDIY